MQDDNGFDEIPTAVKAKLAASAKARAEVAELRSYIGERLTKIENRIESLILAAKILLACVPVIGALAGAIVWAAAHLRLLP